MRTANFTQVEIGLQSTDPATQELMDRKNNLKAFERGVRALRDEGIDVKVDLIIGFPGDTRESILRSLNYLKNNVYDEVQVFNLSVLPGTAFRHEVRGQHEDTTQTRGQRRRGQRRHPSFCNILNGFLSGDGPRSR